MTPDEQSHGLEEYQFTTTHYADGWTEIAGNGRGEWVASTYTVEIEQ